MAKTDAVLTIGSKGDLLKQPTQIVGIGGSEGNQAKVNAEGKLETTASATIAEVIKIEGQEAEGVVLAKKPAPVAGIDSEKKVRTLKTNAEGKLETTGGGGSSEVEGKQAEAAVNTQKPLVISGIDGEKKIRTIKTDATGKPEVSVSNEPIVKGTIKLEGAEGHAAKVNAEGKLETTATATQPSSNKAKETKIEVTNASTEALAAKERKALTVQNIGKEACFISLGKAAALETGIKLEPGGSWSVEAVSWTGSVFMICKTTKEALLLITELE